MGRKAVAALRGGAEALKRQNQSLIAALSGNKQTTSRQNARMMTIQTPVMKRPGGGKYYAEGRLRDGVQDEASPGVGTGQNVQSPYGREIRRMAAS